jgi:UDP-N-acetylglucosamine:LPS N-acetylglucosamine transferase
MVNMKKVLILSASIGGGHNATSNAIRKYAEEFREEYQVTVVDVLEYIGPILSKVAEKTYEINVKNFPEFLSIPVIESHHVRCIEPPFPKVGASQFSK